MVWVSAIQHFLILLVLIVIQSEVCSFFCPRSRVFTLEWRRIMLALLPSFLSCCFWTPWPFQRQLSNLLHLLSNWIANLEMLWEQAIHFNSVSLLSFPMGPGQILRKCSQHLLIEPSDEINFWFSKKPVMCSQLCLGKPRLSHKTEQNLWSSA